MKHLRQALAALALACVLSLSASAGEISCPGVAPPPPPPSAVEEQAAEGQMETPLASEDAASEDAVTETMLALLSGVLSLF